MRDINNPKIPNFIKQILRKLSPRFSFHYVAYTLLFFLVIFSVVHLVGAATPNPGHPWSEVGDGNITFADPGSAVTYTGPTSSATLLTTANLVTVPQGGTGVGSFTSNGILYGNGTGNILVTAAGTTSQCLIGNTGSAPSWGSCGSSTLQGSYDGDTDTGDTTISLTTADDSIIISNPTSSGTDSAFTFKINQQHTTGNVSALDIIQASSGANAINLTANAIDTETGFALSSTALSTGKAQTITLGSALTTGGALAITGASYSHSTETGSLVSLAFTDATTAAVTSTTNGILISPTLNVTTGASGTKTLNGVSIEPTFTACSGGSTCNPNAINIGNVTDGTGITSAAIKLGTGWDTLISGTTAGTNIFSFTNSSLSSGGDLITGNSVGTSTFAATSQYQAFGTNAPNTNANIYRYRTTNGGSEITSRFSAGGTSATAGVIQSQIDATNGFFFSAANGTRQIARGGMFITNLGNSAGSESGDLIFLTQSGGTAMSEKLRITGAGLVNVGANASPTNMFSVGATSQFQVDSSGAIAAVVGITNTGAQSTTVQSATALTVARSGTNYAFQVDTNTASSATGLKITAAAAAGGLALSTISSGTDENLTLDAKGSGAIGIGGTSTGDILFGGGSASTGCTVTNSNGNFACTGTGTFSNFSGTNTGDVTLTTIGATPNANGASLSGQQLQLQPADGSFGGVVTTTTQTFAGAKTFTGLVTGSGNGLGVTQDATKGFSLTNTTAAAAGAQQISPAIRWEGQGWKTDATAASQSVAFRSYVLPSQGSSTPTGSWLLQSSLNGGAYVTRMSVGASDSADTIKIGDVAGGTNLVNITSGGVTVTGSSGVSLVAPAISFLNGSNSMLSFNTTSGSYSFGDLSVVANGSVINLDDTGGSAYYDNSAHNGLFGINTTTPAAALDVVGNGQLTTQSATAFTVARLGTNYALQVDTNTASSVTGLKVTSAAAGGGLALSTISTGTDESITIDAKGAGTVAIGGTSTGNILLGGGSGSTGCTVTNSNGNFACTGTGTFSNFSGTNTGDVTLTTIGATPNANGASLSGQQLQLQPADGSFGGVVTTSSQIFAGTKTFNGGVVIAGGQNLVLSSGAGQIQQTFTTASAVDASAITYAITNSGAGITSSGLVLTPTNSTNPSGGINTLNVINFPAGTGGNDADNNTNGLNFASATGYKNFIKTPTFVLDSSGAVTGAASYNGLVVTANTGVITTGTWQGSVIDSTYGGTGVNNAGRTLTINTNSGTLAFGAASKTLTINNSIALSGTDGTTMTFPSTSATIARTDTAQSFTGVQTFSSAPILSTGTVTVSGNTITFPSTTGTLAILGSNTFTGAQTFTSAAPQITLGVNTTTLGSIKMFGNTSGDVTLQPTAAAGTATVQTLPATTGTLVNRVTTANGVSASNSDGALTFTLGAITPTTVNGNTFTTGSYTLTGTAGKTLNFTNSLTLSGTDSTTMTFPTTSASIARTDAGQTFTGVNIFTSPKIITDISDTNGNELVKFTATGSAINEFTITNAATGTNPQLSATGGGTDVGLDFLVKGAGAYRLLATTSGPTDLRLFEDADNGTNYASLIATANMSGDRVITLPNATTQLIGTDTTDALTNKNLTSGTNTFPTFNQDTTGSALSLKSNATTGLMQIVGPGVGTTRVKTIRDANDTILELGGSYTPTGTWTSLNLNEAVALTTTSTKLNYLTSATGTTGTTSTNIVFSGSPTIATPTITTSATVPLLIGSTSANGTLTFEGNNTTGNTATNANLIFKVGDSAGTTAMTILNNGKVGIGDSTPADLFTVGSGDLFQIDSSGNTSLFGGADMRFVETGGGTDYVAFQAPAAITSPVTWTLPSADSTGTQCLKSNGSGTLSFGSCGGGGGLTIGDAIASGSANRVLYEGSSNLLSESANFTYDGTTLAVATSSTTASNKALNITQTGATSGTDYAGYFSNTGGATTNVGVYATATGATNNYAGVFEAGRVLFGTASETSSISTLYITKSLTNEDGSTGAGVAGIHESFTFNPTSGTPTQVGNRLVVANTGTAATTQIGQIIRMDDSPSSGTPSNTVRGLEVVASVGNNITGINTGIRTTGKTFGIQAITIGTAGGVSAPAALYGETQGTTQGDALRLYSTTITTAPTLAMFYQDTSSWSGTGLMMDFGSASGTGDAFTGNFVDFKENDVTLFKVTSAGVTSLGFSTSQASTSAVCSTLANATAPTASTLYELRDCGAAPVADYAENYPVEDGTEYGDIVVTGTDMINTYDVTNGNIDWNKIKGKITKLVKSSKSYQDNVIGIVSDNHGDFTSAGHNIKKEDNPMPVALNGRVPVKVASDSGPIMPGDYITTSDQPGKATKATKAGIVIGKALEVWIPDSNTPTVMVYVEQGFYNGQGVSQFAGIDPVSNDFAKQVLHKFMNSQNTNSSSELVLDRLAVGLEIITPKLVADNVSTNTITASTGDNIGLVLSPDGKFTIGDGATNSNPAITFDALGNATFNGKVKASEIEVGNLAGIQDITNQINQLSEGQLAFSLTASVINTLSGALTIAQSDIIKLQGDIALINTKVDGLTTSNLDLADRLGAIETILSANAFNALNSLNTNTLQVGGDANFAGLTIFSGGATFNGDIKIGGQAEFTVPPLYNKNSAGYALIKQGDRRARIEFSQPYIATPVVNTSVTFETTDNVDDTEANTLFSNDVRFIIVGKDQTGFTILLNKNAPRDVRFSWNALAVKDPSIFESVFEGLTIDPTPSTPDPIPTPDPTPNPDVVPDGADSPEATPDSQPDPNQPPAEAPASDQAVS